MRGQQGCAVLHQLSSTPPQIQDSRERSRSFGCANVPSSTVTPQKLSSMLAFMSPLGRHTGNPPEGRKRVPVRPSSVTGILQTPGATYHLSTITLAKGSRSWKPWLRWPGYTEMVTSMGVSTLHFLILRGTSAVVMFPGPGMPEAAGHSCRPTLALVGYLELVEDSRVDPFVQPQNRSRPDLYPPKL